MRGRWITGFAFTLFFFTAYVSSAQLLTTGTITGMLKDGQGGVIPGATITLVSETKGTPVPPAISESTGEFLVPNLAPDTYRLTIELQGFKSLERRGVAVSGGDRLNLGTLTLEVGTLNETITVTGESPLVQTTSGEMRISNFLLWQIAYSEIWVTETLWPDFRRRDLLQAVLAYQKRDRRYGGIKPSPVALGAK